MSTRIDLVKYRKLRYIYVMNIGDRIRQERKARKWSQVELAHRCGWEYQGRISNYETGVREPDLEDLGLIAKAFGVAIPELLSDPNQREGGAFYDSNVEPGPEIYGVVPLISEVQAGNWEEAINNYQPGDGERGILCSVPHSRHTFALRVSGASMEPKFHKGEIIVVDPEQSFNNGDYIVARRLDNQKATFKQLISEGGEYYLKALNPHWPEQIIVVDTEWEVCGVVISRQEYFR